MRTHMSPDRFDVGELVINWHLLEPCNYKCGFCYGKWDKPSAGREICRDPTKSDELLRELGRFFDPGNADNPLSTSLVWQSLRLTLAGGEPTLIGDRLPAIAKSAREHGFKVALITNGSRLHRGKAAVLSSCLDILGISIDSADAHTNTRIGRVEKSGISLRLDDLEAFIREARAANPALQVKINTVINSHNAHEDMSDLIERIKPAKWKLFRALPVISDALCVSATAFDAYVDRHRRFAEIISKEDNEAMTMSYLMVDPYGRFFQNQRSGRGYDYSDPILKDGAARAFEGIRFLPEAFALRYLRAPQEQCN
jgi:radical S-adenosyl methionine domain-containing protein 2